MSDHLVGLAEPVGQRIDHHKASMMLFDTPGIEAWVTENNPKYVNYIIKQLKAFKFGIITNGPGIVRDISFYNKEFIEAYPDIIAEKKSGSPDKDKSLADSKALIPV